MATSLIRRPEGNGASPQIVLSEAGPAEYYLPASRRGIAAQASAALGLLTGVWVPLAAVALRASLFTDARNKLTGRPAR